MDGATTNEKQLSLIEKLKYFRVTPMKEALIQGIKEIIAQSFELGFHPAKTGINSTFICTLESTMVESFHQETLDFVFTKSFYRLIQSDALVSTLVKTGTQSPRSQATPTKSLSSSKNENVASDD